MAIGACFAAANTMYAQVAARAREIGTLRALGFKRRSIMGSFFLEAVLLGVVAGGFGALLSLPLNAIQTGTMNQVTFSEITFQLRTTPFALFSGHLPGHRDGCPGRPAASLRRLAPEDHRPPPRSVAPDWLRLPVRRPVRGSSDPHPGEAAKRRAVLRV